MAGAVGLAINRLRHGRGWSAQRLAEECARLGLPSLTRGTIAKIESGVRKSVTADELLTLARALEVTAEELAGREPPAAATDIAAAPAKRTYRSSRPLMTRQTVRELRSDLARAYEAALDRPVIEMDTLPPAMVVPTVADAFITPQFRIAAIGPASSPSDEGWWSEQPIRDDLDLLLAHHLSGPAATKSPLLILGQPGSGKSLLTKVLAARLSSADFTPLRVALRMVPAEADPQDQIEVGIRETTGERMDWPTFARSIGGSLPVVLLDGLDELITATGVGQSDYLVRVAQFQQREADLGRPIAALVTSRTVYADQTRIPPETLAVRLEPFDDERIARWLSVWNAVNAPELAARGLRQLSLASVLAQPELARQPLLLLMLALADADDNALQRVQGAGSTELHERLLVTFTRRELQKAGVSLPDERFDRAVEDKLDELSIVAFAMFNRGSPRVRAGDLAADLQALRGEREAAASASGFRRPQRPEEALIGRFFFVHNAHAMREVGRDAERTYEFLHETFAEYLVARFTWRALREINDDSRIWRIGMSSPDDGLLYALLSFGTLNSRRPIVAFLADLASSLPESDRERLLQHLARLLRGVHHTRPNTYDSYQPQWLTPTARLATYTVNLVLLAVAVGGSVRVSQLFAAEEDAVDRWRRQEQLWCSQLRDHEWSSLSDLLQNDRIKVKNAWDVLLTFAPRGLSTRPESLAATAEEASAVHALMLAWLAPTDDLPAARRRAIYELGARIAAADAPSWSGATNERYLTLLLDKLATDESAPVDVAADILDGLAASGVAAAVHASAVRCASALLGRDPGADRRISTILARFGARRPAG